MPERWLKLVDAAEALGITPEAVKMRAKRGTLDSQKRDDGRLYVRVVADYTKGERREDVPPSALVEQLRSEVAYLREENQRKDSIIMQMARRIPELEPPRAHEASEDDAPEPTETSGRVTEGEASEELKRSGQRPWWRRIFGGERLLDRESLAVC